MAQAPMKATITATTLTVSWNWRNFAMESYTLRPHITAFTIELKLSSVRMMSEASLATSVPAIPWGLKHDISKDCLPDLAQRDHKKQVTQLGVF